MPKFFEKGLRNGQKWCFWRFSGGFASKFWLKIQLSWNFGSSCQTWTPIFLWGGIQRAPYFQPAPFFLLAGWIPLPGSLRNPLILIKKKNTGLRQYCAFHFESQLPKSAWKHYRLTPTSIVFLPAQIFQPNWTQGAVKWCPASNFWPNLFLAAALDIWRNSHGVGDIRRLGMWWASKGTDTCTVKIEPEGWFKHSHCGYLECRCYQADRYHSPLQQLLHQWLFFVGWILMCWGQFFFSGSGEEGGRGIICTEQSLRVFCSFHILGFLQGSNSFFWHFYGAQSIYSHLSIFVTGGE